MNRDSRVPIVILTILVVGVLVSVAVIAYLIISQQQEGASPAEGGEVLALLDGELRIAYVTDQSREDESSAVYMAEAQDGEQRSPAVQRVAGSKQGVCLLPAWSPDGQRIAYTVQEPGDNGVLWDDDDRMQVWVAAADGSEQIRISDAIPEQLLVNWLPVAWFPDGKRLAFVTIRETEPGAMYREHNTFHIAQADGGGIEQSIQLPLEIRSVSLSPTGDEVLLIVWQTYEEFERGVYVISIETQEITQVYAGAVHVAGWSPDGTEIVVGTDLSQQVLILGPDRTPRWAVDLGEYPVEIAWSPDGSRIAVGTSSDNTQYTSTALYIVSVETGETNRLLDETETSRLSWSSDGNRLLFDTIDGLREGGDLPSATLWIYDVPSGELEQLTDGEAYAGMGTWAP
jgi:Tol biopolymer transport system component